MATITLNKGSATGTPVTFTLAYIDLDALEEGTDYDFVQYFGDPFDLEITLPDDTTCKSMLLALHASAFSRLNWQDATPLYDAQLYTGDGTNYSQTGFIALPPGVQPTDWALHWRDKYYLQNTIHNPDPGKNVISYRRAGDTWSASDTYYENTSAGVTYWTPNNGYFGAGGLWGYSGSNVAFSGGALQDMQFQQYGGGKDGRFMPRYGGVSGTPLFPDLYNSFDGGLFAEGEDTGNYAGQYLSTPRSILIQAQLGGVQYVGVALLKFAVDNTLTYCQFWLAGSKFWVSDDIQPDTPGDWGGNSSNIKPSGGGNTTFANNVGIDISFPSALDSAGWGGNAGGIHLWAMTDSQYAGMNNGIWNRDFLDRITDFGKNPGAGIIGAHAMPDGFSYSGSAVNISLYGVRPIKDELGMPVGGHPLNARTYTVDCGTVTVNPYSGYYPDYSAECLIYLPFIGTMTLDIKKVMRSTLHLVYRFDCVTGDCMAMLEASTAYPDGVSHATGTAIIMQAQGNAAFDIPYAYSDGGVQAKLSALAGALTGGISAASGNPAGVMSIVGAMSQMGQEKMSASGFGGGAGTLGKLRPFIWIKYPDPVSPANYLDTIGRMSGAGGTVGETQGDGIAEVHALSGFQKFESVDLDGIGATAEECAEIERLLKEGVYL